MLGLFSGEETAKLFYTADLDVLLDVILRRLVDYGPGDKVFKAFFWHKTQILKYYILNFYRDDLMPCSYTTQYNGSNVQNIRKSISLNV